MKWRSLEESSAPPETRSLREQFVERKELILKYAPPEIQSVHAKAIAALKQSGIESQALARGSKAPDFELRDHQGKLTSRAHLLTVGRLVICFFRGRWCPFCVGQMEAMQQVLPRIKAAGAALVAISPQTVQQNFFMADQHRLTFPLLYDTGNHVARQFGLVYRASDEQQAVYRRAFVNLPFVNGDDSWELPIPAVYVLDGQGSVLLQYANADYTERLEREEIVQFLCRQ